MRRVRESDRGPPPCEPCVPVDDVVEKVPRESDRNGGKRVQGPRRLLCGHGAAPFLDQLDEAVRGVERQLHSHRVGERTFAWQVRPEGAAGAAPRTEPGLASG